jgi:hypothetical protein
MSSHTCCDEKRRAAAGGGTPAGPPAPEEPELEPQALRDAAIAAFAERWPFGPVFFLGQLGAFVRDKCPDPGEGLPVVEIHLADGDVLDLCHVIGVAPTWVALAVNEIEAREDQPRMRTELVPYARIAQVTVRSCRSGSPHLGFASHQAPELLAPGNRVPATPESALRAAAAPVVARRLAEPAQPDPDDEAEPTPPEAKE